MTSRDAFLQRVRQAVTEGNRAGSAAPLPGRGDIGLAFRQGGAGGVERFCTELAAAGGKAHLVCGAEQMWDRLLSIIDDKKARRILLAPVFAEMNLTRRLREQGLEAVCTDDLAEAERRDVFFRADLGLTGATHLVAETGSVILAAAPPQPRSVSLLPPVHVVLARADQILADLFDLFTRYGQPGRDTSASNLPSCLSIITGPSKTGDIELKLVTGVHGPGEVHVILDTPTGILET